MMASRGQQQRPSYHEDDKLVEVDLPPGVSELPEVQKLGTVNRSPTIRMPLASSDSVVLTLPGRSNSPLLSDRSSGGSENGGSSVGISARDSLLNLTALNGALELEGDASSRDEVFVSRFQTRSGICEKLCPSFYTFGLLWQSRWLRLSSDGALYYYVDESSAEASSSRGVIHISDIRKTKDGKSHKLKRSGKLLVVGVHSKHRRNYKFQFQTDTECRAWEGALRSHL